MDMGVRHFVTILHGWICGGVLLLGLGLLLFALADTTPSGRDDAARSEGRIVSYGIWGLAGLAWVTTFVGAYVVYPWYRVKPPSPSVDLSLYPRAFLLASPHFAWWHTIGMEWKEHVSWFAPITLTMVAYGYAKYHSTLADARGLRNMLLAVTTLSLLSVGVAGAWGIALNTVAPVAPTANTEENAP